MKDGIVLGGWFDMWCLERRRIKWKERFYNGICNAALNDILAVQFGASAQRPLWYAGLIDNTGFTQLLGTDTAASHPSWQELQSYSQAFRPAWTPGTVANQLITNPTVINFTINAVCTVRGAFIISNSTKGGNTGMLWASGVFDIPQAMTSPPQTLSLIYSLGAGGS